MTYRAERVDAVFLMSVRSVRGKKIPDNARSFTFYIGQSYLAFLYFDNGSTRYQNA